MTVSAAASLTVGNTIDRVEVNGLDWTENPAIVAGDTISVRVEFTSDVNASDITVEVELETDKEDVEAQTRVFDVEAGNKYVKILKLEVPFDLKDELSDFVTLTVKISGDGFKTTESEELRVQRLAYDTNILSISTKSSIDAGETFSVDVVLKNVGYNDLDDLYVTASIPALDLERTVYFGDLVAVECDDNSNSLDNYGVDIDRKCNEDDEDTVRGRILLEVPYNVQSGVYTLEVEVRNNDVIINRAKQIFIENAVPETVLKSGNSLIVINPTNTLKVYSIIPESPATVSDSVIVVPAGSSRQVTVNSNSAGSFSVSVLSGNEVVGTVQFSSLSEDSSTTGVVVLTVILAIVFLVLLIVLVVLLTKKPDKEEEFGESYY
ncbi:MAG: hypothetical protein IIA85_00725 [Nanoarchaeota archaeon]|nr:hypothetical protein [Nanoarchaeota archaeon]